MEEGAGDAEVPLGFEEDFVDVVEEVESFGEVLGGAGGGEWGGLGGRQMWRGGCLKFMS